MECIQLNLFDLMCAKKAEETKPCLAVGQEVFFLNLDVVRTGKVNRAWLCSTHEKSPYFGYSVDLEKGMHNVTCDTEIGKKVFVSKHDAVNKAALIEPMLDKILPQEMDIHDQRSFQYCRSCDSYNLFATVAKVGENQIYRKLFMTYHFLETYPTSKIRDKQYHAFLEEIQRESINQGGTEIEGQPLLETLYRSTDTLYASWEYAERNGNPYKKSEN